MRARRASRGGLRRLALEQAALRRVATLVARGASQAEVFDAVVVELGRLFGGYHTALLRYDADGMATFVAAYQPAHGGRPTLKGQRWPFDDDDEVTAVLRAGRAARTESAEVDTTATDRTAHGISRAALRAQGYRTAVLAAVVVEGRLWGITAVASPLSRPLPPDTEERIAAFTELVAAAIANADSRAELVASRARMVAAADEARRRIERDLHDGAQQRLVSLGLQLRAVEEAVPDGLKPRLSRTVEGLGDVVENLREISQGIHPAILSESGLSPALKTLARRSAVPVELDMRVGERLPEHVEVAAYYVVSEALTNAAKHASASVVRVHIGVDSGTLRLSIADDGIGGADPARGTGLIGLRDRVEAVGGTLDISSIAGHGTSLSIVIPAR
ncbi:GAF domain-containing sensor histidine kinase [Dactylosporangium darangshiense]|uniref:histidine kinase n=1 Tax=Dactylosporangium darangshiense TaxID=579108 RepID=A0ABP8DHN4_9ACTN